LVSDELTLKNLKSDYNDGLFISALHHLKLSDIKSHLIEKIEGDFKIFNVRVTYEQGKILSQIQDQAEILDTEYGDKYINLKIRGHEKSINKLLN